MESTNPNSSSSPAPAKKSKTTKTSASSKEPAAATATKKPSRKTKTAKVEVEETVEPVQIVSNVILHLKCTMADLEEYDTQMNRLLMDPLKYNPDVPPEVDYYKESAMTMFAAEYDGGGSTAKQTQNANRQYCSSCNCGSGAFDVQEEETDAEKRELKQKLKELKVQLYKNAVLTDKKSACFWDTCEYDNPPCRIPVFIAGDTIHGYGSFCRPECAVAYLFEENLDDSTKFERYQLINRIYGPIYNYKKNIKPAPSPYYTLDKYYGDFSIQEYRRLLKSEHLLMVVEKPFTRILPELHEDTDELMTNVYGINKTSASSSGGGIYKVKRQSERPAGPSKSSVLADKFTK